MPICLNDNRCQNNNFMLKYTDNSSMTNKILNNSKIACKMMINNNIFL